jgi:hypothetical protein
LVREESTKGKKGKEPALILSRPLAFVGEIFYNALTKGKGMETHFSEASLLQRLEEVAAQLQVEVRYENLTDDEIFIHSGGCRMMGRNLILIDARLSSGERARILARELGKYDLEDLYILPRVRDFIDLHSPPREKNLPQK